MGAELAPLPLAIVVHGGAGDIPPEEREAHRAGCERAATAGWELLRQGASALDAIEAVIRLLEDDPTYDAGLGSVLTSAGSVEVDAGLMDGTTLRIGAVAALQHYANPIAIARRVLDETAHHLLVGPGAEAFAAERGFPAIANAALIVERERALYEQFRAGHVPTRQMVAHDTVGALALDAQGRMAAGNSTGGVRFSLPGRVGDAPLPGVGYYADDRFGAVACTGVGEHIMRVGLALRAMHTLEEGEAAAEAAARAIALLRGRVSGQAGLIVLDAQGRVGLGHSTPQLAHAFRTHTMSHVASGIEATNGAP